MYRNTSFIILSLQLLACSHQAKLKNDHLISGRCDQEFNRAQLSEGEILWQKATEAGGTGVSYLVTGLAYSTDFIVTITGGVIGGIALCSPVIAVETISSSSSGSSKGSASGNCIGEIGMNIGQKINPKLGPSARDYTKTWQCPKLDHIAEGLLNIADCYSESGEPELARQQLQKIDNSDVFKQCLSEKIKLKIKSKLDT